MPPAGESSQGKGKNLHHLSQMPGKIHKDHLKGIAFAIPFLRSFFVDSSGTACNHQLKNALLCNSSLDPHPQCFIVRLPNVLVWQGMQFRYRAGMGSNDYSCNVHALPAGASRPILYLYCITQKMPCFLRIIMLKFRLRKY